MEAAGGVWQGNTAEYMLVTVINNLYKTTLYVCL